MTRLPKRPKPARRFPGPTRSERLIVSVHEDELERLRDARVRLRTSRPRWPGIQRGDRMVPQ